MTMNQKTPFQLLECYWTWPRNATRPPGANGQGFIAYPAIQKFRPTCGSGAPTLWDAPWFGRCWMFAVSGRPP